MKEEQSQVCTYNGSVGTSLWLQPHYANPRHCRALHNRESVSGTSVPVWPLFACVVGAAQARQSILLGISKGAGGSPQGIRVTGRARSQREFSSSSN